MLQFNYGSTLQESEVQTLYCKLELIVAVGIRIISFNMNFIELGQWYISSDTEGKEKIILFI